MNQLYISASLIKDYLSCHRKVYYRLFRPKEVIQSPEMLVGSMVHKVLETCWDNQEHANEFISNGNLDDNLKESCLTCVNNYFEHFSWLLNSYDVIEKTFSIKIGTDINLVGKMDRIGDYGVIDWKTSSRTPKSIDNDVQFMVYYLAYQEIYKKDPISVLYISLKDSAIVRFCPNEVLLFVLKHELIPEIVESIRRKTLSPTGFFSHTCYKCQYQKHCFEEFGSELDNSAPTNAK